jgi:hypothetical protein
MDRLCRSRGGGKAPYGSTSGSGVLKVNLSLEPI